MNTEQPFVVLLVVGDYIFWYTSWGEEFEYVPIDIGIGAEKLNVLEFEWPQENSAMYNVIFYGAILDKTLTRIEGHWDFVEFGWDSNKP